MFEQRLRSICLVGVMTLAFTVPAGAQGRGGRGRGGQNAPLTTVMIKPGLYMVPGGGATSLFRVTDDGIVVVNAKQRNEDTYNEFIGQIRTVSDKPIRYAIVGDVHQDKSGGTEFFTRDGVQVIAHVNEKAGLETYTNANGTPAPPDVTYDREYPVSLGGAEVAHVYYFGRASTNGDSITYFPDLGVVSMGDVFQGGMNCDYAQGGSMIEWPKTLDAVLALDFDTVIPNRGDPATRADLEAARDRVARIDEIGIDLVRKGTAKEELLDAINAVDESLRVNAFLNINAEMRLDAFYAELLEAAR